MSKKKISIIVIILGILLLGIGLVLMFTDKESGEKPKDPPKEPTVIESKYIESLNPSDDLVQSLYYKTKGYWYGDYDDNSYYYYKTDKLLVSDFEKVYLYNLVFERIYKKDLLSDNLTVKEDDVKAEFEDIFGSYVTYSKIDSFSNGCYHVMYDNVSSQYKYLLTNGCVGLLKVLSEVTAAHRYTDKIVIEESVLFSDGFDYYYDVELNKKSNSTMIDVNDSNIVKYNYTFMYDNNLDKYFFYSIEKVK